MDIDSSKMAEKEEEDLSIPRAAMNKLIKEIVPDVRVANETREVVLNCCKEFIRLVTSQANSICEEQQKKTMSGEHVLMALSKLGMDNYRREAELVLNNCKGKRRRQSTRLEHLGIPEEELLRQQQELFAKARAEQAVIEQEEWIQMQNAALEQHSQLKPFNSIT
jgi:protein dr1